MRLVIQRTSGVELVVNKEPYSMSAKGLLILFGTKEGDTAQFIPKMADKTVNLRIFEDENGKMNLSALDIGAELMVVSQFTLYADLKKGRRPSFNDAQNPVEAEKLYDLFVETLKTSGLKVATGSFGAEMDLKFNNDGPVTIILDDEIF